MNSLSQSLEGCFSIPEPSNSIWSGAPESLDLLILYITITLVLYITIILISSLIQTLHNSQDHAPFRTAFNKIKSLFNQTESAFTEEVRYSASAPPSMHDSLSSSMSTSVPFFDCLGEEEAHEALDSVLKMGREKKVDTQIEAARIFCDLSSNEDDIFQQLLCESESMKVLLDLAGPESPELARQYIFMALANLSMHHGHCQERIIDAGALPTILPLVSNGSYESAEMRREGARILANLSGGLAARVVNELGHASVSTWMNTVDNLADERVRLHAMQARDQLTGLVV